MFFFFTDIAAMTKCLQLIINTKLRLPRTINKATYSLILTVHCILEQVTHHVIKVTVTRFIMARGLQSAPTICFEISIGHYAVRAHCIYIFVSASHR